MGEFVAKFWVQWVMGLLAGAIALGYRALSKRIKATSAKNCALEQGIKELLRDRIVQGYNHYLDRGCWPIYARDAILGMYKSYTALGGNGTVPDLIEELRELPTEKKKGETI